MRRRQGDVVGVDLGSGMRILGIYFFYIVVLFIYLLVQGVRFSFVLLGWREGVGQERVVGVYFEYVFGEVRLFVCLLVYFFWVYWFRKFYLVGV